MGRRLIGESAQRRFLAEVDAVLGAAVSRVRPRLGSRAAAAVALRGSSILATEMKDDRGPNGQVP
jgi:hypothetical protein